MNKLHLYACSYGLYGTAVGPDAHKWTDENSFGSLLASRLHLEFVNRSRAGASNFHLMKRVLADLDKNNFNENDIVLIQWTYLDRAYHNDDDLCVMPHDKSHTDYYTTYYNDLQSLINVISYTSYIKSKIKCKLFFTLVDLTSTIENISTSLFRELVFDDSFLLKGAKTPIHYFWELGDKELVLPCHHPSLKGHQVLADIYYSLLYSP